MCLNEEAQWRRKILNSTILRGILHPSISPEFLPLDCDVHGLLLCAMESRSFCRSCWREERQDSMQMAQCEIKFLLLFVNTRGWCLPYRIRQVRPVVFCSILCHSLFMQPSLNKFPLAFLWNLKLILQCLPCLARTSLSKELIDDASLKTTSPRPIVVTESVAAASRGFFLHLCRWYHWQLFRNLCSHAVLGIEGVDNTVLKGRIDLWHHQQR